MTVSRTLVYWGPIHCRSQKDLAQEGTRPDAEAVDIGQPRRYLFLFV